MLDVAYMYVINYSFGYRYGPIYMFSSICLLNRAAHFEKYLSPSPCHGLYPEGTNMMHLKSDHIYMGAISKTELICIKVERYC